MPDNLMNRFPYALNNLEAMKIPLRIGAEMLEHGIRSLSLGFDLSNKSPGPVISADPTAVHPAGHQPAESL